MILPYTGLSTPQMTILRYNSTLIRCPRVTSKLLSLNSNKCRCLLFFCKRSRSIPLPSLTLGDAPLTQVSYLGVLITSNLVVSHITNICNKTRRLFEIFYRQFYKHSSLDTMLRLYTSFIRPHLEYAMAAWDLFIQKDIESIENVAQRNALRVCFKSWDANYNSRLESSGLPSLESRRANVEPLYLYRLDTKAKGSMGFRILKTYINSEGDSLRIL